MNVTHLTTAMLSNASSAFAGTNGAITGGSVTMNTSGISINLPAYLTTAAQVSHSHGNPTLALTNINGTTASASNGLTLSLSAAGGAGDGFNIVGVNGNSVGSNVTVQFSNSNNVTFGLNGSTITASASYSQPGATVFSNSNNVTFGLNGSTITATASYVNDLTSGRAGVGETVTTTAGTDLKLTVDTNGVNIAHPAWITTYAAGGGDAIRGFAAGGSTATTNTVNFANSNNISFGFGAGANSTNVTADVQLAASNSAGSFTFKTLNFSNANNVTFGTSAGSIVTASVAAPGGAVTVQGGYSNIQNFTGTVTLGYIRSTSHVVPFDVGYNLSFDYVRIEALPVVLAASTTAATAANTTFSVGYTKTHNLALYSISQGVSSDTLQLYRSTQFLEYFSGNMGQGAASAGGQFYSNRYTLPCSSGNYGFTYDYTSTAASFNVNSAGITGLTGTKFVEIPFGTSITPGRWFLMYGASTTTATQAAGTTIGLRNNVTYNPIFMSQAAQSIGTFGAATSNIYGPQQGLGSFTTVGGATTGSLHITKITVSAAHPRLYFHLMRSA